MKRTIVLLCICMCFAACESTKKNKEEISKFKVVNPLLTDTLSVHEYIADIQSLQNVEIRTKINGYLEKIHVDEGKPVKAGQLLFSLNNKELKQELLKARAMLKTAFAESKTAEIEVQNIKKLVDKKIVAKSELDKAEAILEATKAKIEAEKAHEQSAQISLELTQIKAPFNGTINRIPFKIGSLINEGTMLTSISNNKEVYAYFSVSEKEYLEYITLGAKEEENKITLLLANGENHDYQGKIETIDGEFDKNTGNIAFRAKFPNPKLLLKHGSSGKIQLTKKLKNALIIPQKSTFEIQDKLFVYVVDEKNKVKEREITILDRIPNLYAVASGLKPNDKVIYEGIQNLKQGMVVEPQVVSMKTIINQLKTN